MKDQDSMRLIGKKKKKVSKQQADEFNDNLIINEVGATSTSMHTYDTNDVTYEMMEGQTRRKGGHIPSSQQSNSHRTSTKTTIAIHKKKPRQTITSDSPQIAPPAAASLYQYAVQEYNNMTQPKTSTSTSGVIRGEDGSIDRVSSARHLSPNATNRSGALPSKITSTSTQGIKSLKTTQSLRQSYSHGSQSQNSTSSHKSKTMVPYKDGSIDRFSRKNRGKERPSSLSPPRRKASSPIHQQQSASAEADTPQYSHDLLQASQSGDASKDTHGSTYATMHYSTASSSIPTNTKQSKTEQKDQPMIDMGSLNHHQQQQSDQKRTSNSSSSSSTIDDYSESNSDDDDFGSVNISYAPSKPIFTHGAGEGAGAESVMSGCTLSYPVYPGSPAVIYQPSATPIPANPSTPNKTTSSTTMNPHAAFPPSYPSEYYNTTSSWNNLTQRYATSNKSAPPVALQMAAAAASKGTYTPISPTKKTAKTNSNYANLNANDLNESNDYVLFPHQFYEPEMPDVTYEEWYGDAYISKPLRYIYPNGYGSMRPRSFPWKMSVFICVSFTWLTVFIVGHCSSRVQWEDWYYRNNQADDANDDDANQNVDDDIVAIEIRWCGSRTLYLLWVMSVLITGLACAYCSIIGYIKARDFAVANGRSQPPGMIGKSDYYVRIEEAVEDQVGGSNRSIGKVGEEEGKRRKKNPRNGTRWSTPVNTTGSYQGSNNSKKQERKYRKTIYQADGTPKFIGTHIYRPNQAAVHLTSR